MEKLSTEGMCDCFTVDTLAVMKRGLTCVSIKEDVLFRVATFLGVGLRSSRNPTCPGTLWVGKARKRRLRRSVPTAPAAVGAGGGGRGGASPGHHVSKWKGRELG